MKKSLKIVLTILTVFIIIITSIINVNAAPDSIQLGKATEIDPYIGGVSFYYKVTTDGKYLYCIDMHKDTAQNIKANLVKDSKIINGGLVYILKNGYPNKSFTGNKDKDYYITQTAVWWYLDNTTGSTNLGDTFKVSGPDTHDMRKYVKQLVDEGYAHRNDTIIDNDSELVINSEGSNAMTLVNDYYISDFIIATTVKNVDEYTVSLENAPKNTVIVYANGTETVYTKAFTIKAADKFKVKVPKASLTSSELLIKVKASAVTTGSEKAYEYQPEDSNMQHVALLEKTDKNLESNINLVNAKEVIVPDTSSETVVYYTAIGLVITSIGIRFVIKNKKNA